MKSLRITDWCHEIFRAYVRENGVYIDGTMGKGMDTLFVCHFAGEEGKVYAFDVQEKALEMTRLLLEKEGVRGRARLIRDGHEHMDAYLPPESADGICFNFGYLPGGDHRIATKPETSVEAVKKGLGLLKQNGVMSLCIYSGGDTGFAEKEALLHFLGGLPANQFTVILNSYYNRENHPPIPAFVFKRR